MKKTVLLLLCAGLYVSGLWAQSRATQVAGDYIGKLYIALMSEVDPSDDDAAIPGQAVTLTAGQTENTVTLTLYNFSMDGSTVLGDIQLPDIPISYDEATAGITFGANDPVSLTLMEGSATELHATAQLEVSKSQLLKKHLTARLNVLWTNGPIPGGMPIDVLFEGDLSHFQLPNSGFEAWSNDNEPAGWHSFASAGGELSWAASMTKATTVATTGRNGLALQIASKNVIIANANGNVTTGRINMGSMTPTDAANYNYTDTSEDSEYNLPFTGVPDSIVFYARLLQPEANTNNARGLFVLHGDYPMKDPTPADEKEEADAFMIASGNVTVTRTADWTRFSAPMEYTGAPQDKMYMLASFTTNPVPGGSANDTLQVDDVAFIYNSRLASLTVNGTTLTGFDKNTFEYILTQNYSKEDGYIAAQADGAGATVETTYDDAQKIVTIVVRGNDFAVNKANTHTYTLYFGSKPDKVESPAVAADTPVDVYTTDGICLRRNVKAAEATKGLRKGNYIVNGKKVNVR